MRLFNCTLYIQRFLLFLILVLTIVACNNAENNSANEEDDIVFEPESFINPDTVIAIKNKILANPPISNPIQAEGLQVNIPLFYYYETTTDAGFPLPFISETSDDDDYYDDGDDKETEKKQQEIPKVKTFELIPTFTDKYDIDEYIAVTDTAVANDVVLSHFKENNYERINKIVYQDETTYIGVGSFDALIVFYFTPDTVQGNRVFYYAKATVKNLSQKETVRYAFQLLQHGRNFLGAVNSTSNANNFSDQLNEVEYKILEKTIYSAKKEAAVFLDDKSYVSYKLLQQAGLLHLLPNTLSAQLTQYASSLPFNQATPITTIAELCDAVDMNFINLWRSESVVRIPPTPLNNNNIIVLEITPTNNPDNIKRLHLLAPININNKKSLLWLQVHDGAANNFERDAYIQLLNLIQSKI